MVFTKPAIFVGFGTLRVYTLHNFSTRCFESSEVRPFEDFGLYWVLCEQRWDRSVIVPRLEALAEVEVQALTGVLEKPEDVRMHSCGVESY